MWMVGICKESYNWSGDKTYNNSQSKTYGNPFEEKVYLFSNYMFGRIFHIVIKLVLNKNIHIMYSIITFCITFFINVMFISYVTNVI